jgi:hypothetical protein
MEPIRLIEMIKALESVARGIHKKSFTNTSETNELALVNVHVLDSWSFALEVEISALKSWLADVKC